jgi:hypothetical protein
MEWVYEQRGDAANPDADVVQTPLRPSTTKPVTINIIIMTIMIVM